MGVELNRFGPADVAPPADAPPNSGPVEGGEANKPPDGAAGSEPKMLAPVAAAGVSNVAASDATVGDPKLSAEPKLRPPKSPLGAAAADAGVVAAAVEAGNKLLAVAGPPKSAVSDGPGPNNDGVLHSVRTMVLPLLLLLVVI